MASLARRFSRVGLTGAATSCGLVFLALSARMAPAGSARDYLNAPIDTWLTFYNFGYSALVTPEDGMDVTSAVRSNVLSQSVVVTRTMDYGGRTGGISMILPYRSLNASSDAFRASNQGISDISFLWQMNIFGGPALLRASGRQTGRPTGRPSSPHDRQTGLVSCEALDESMDSVFDLDRIPDHRETVLW